MSTSTAIYRAITVGYLSIYVGFYPLVGYAAALQTDGSTPTTQDAARNNVPVVNIANPNATGLSHNRFSQYNVGPEGLILNNATTTGVNTQLGGYIYGNKNLTSSAKVILNEVTSANRSQLNGYTEVAGPSADLVIANPNGITINGGGFINTNAVTLTTGRPNIINGAIDSLAVSGGDITIEGAGLNTSAQASTRLYTHYLRLNALLHAQDLDIKLGNNTVRYADQAILASSNITTGGLLLDASALGGMYANRITLVGTEKGMGVNLPPEVLANTGDLTITNDGNVVLQAASAKQNANIQASGNITLNKQLTAQGNVLLDARGSLTSATGITGQAVNLNAGQDIGTNQLASAGSLTMNAGRNITTNTVSAGPVWMNAGGTLGISNVLASTGSVVLAAQGDLLARGGLTGNGIDIRTGGNIGLGQLSANGALILKGQNIAASGAMTAQQVGITAAGDLSLNQLKSNSTLSLNAGRNLLLNADVAAQWMKLAAGGTTGISGALYSADALTLTSQGDVTASGGLTAKRIDLTSNGALTLSQLYSGGALNLKAAGSVATNGATTAQQIAINAGGEIRGTGALYSYGTLDLTAAGNVSNSGGLTATGLTVNAGNDISLGALYSNSALALTAARHVTTSGAVTAQQVGITAGGDIGLKNSLYAYGAIALAATGSVLASGGISGKGVDIRSGGDIALNQLYSSDLLTLNATRHITTSGAVGAQQIGVTAGGNVTLNHALESIGTMALNATGSITSTSALQGNGITLTAGSDIALNQLYSSGLLNLTAGRNVSTTGGVGAQQVDLLAGNAITLGGLLSSSSRLALTATAGDVVTNGLTAKQQLDIRGKSVTLKGKSYAAGALTVNATSALATTGDVTAQGVDLNAGSDVTLGGLLYSTAGANIKATSGNVAINGGLTAAQAVQLNAGKALGLNSQLYTLGALTANAGTTLTTLADVTAQSLGLTAGGDITLNNQLFASTTLAATTAGNLFVNGIAAAKDSLALTAANVSVKQGATLLAGVAQDGTQNSASALSVKSTTLTNQGAIQSVGNLDLNASTSLLNTAQITAGNTLTATTANFNNSGATVAAKNGQITTTHFTNVNGTVSASNDLTLATTTLDQATSGLWTLYAGRDLGLTVYDTATYVNRSNLAFSSERNLTLNVGGAFDNQNNLIANGFLKVAAGGQLLNTSGYVISGGALDLSGNSLINANGSKIVGSNLAVNRISITNGIDNSAKVSAVGDLVVTGGNITNSGFFVAGNDLTLNAQNLTNTTTLFAGRDLAINTASSLTNSGFTANILAQRDLYLGGVGGARTGSIINDRANIESFGGNISINADSFSNLAASGPTVQGVYDAATQTITGGVTTASVTTNYPSVAPAWPAPKRITETTTDMVLQAMPGKGATLQSDAGSVTITANSFVNDYSQVVAGADVNITAGSIDNRSVDIMRVVTVTTETGGFLCLQMLGRTCQVQTFGFVVSSITNTPTVIGNIGSTIQAVGSVNINGGTLSNGGSAPNRIANNENASTTLTTNGTSSSTAVGSGVAATGGASNTAAGAEVAAPTGTTPVEAAAAGSAGTAGTAGTAGSASNAPQVATNITLPTNDYGLFVTAKNPNSKYLIETNPELTIYSNFISSDYLLNKVGTSPDQSIKRVGDGFYESKLIRESIFAQTGLHFLNAEIKNDQQQYQYLMDNAVAEKEALQLTPGIALSAAQRNALKHDIVWMEEKIVAGQKVLVPVVYIGKSSSYELKGSKIIAGKEISLKVTQLDNAGTIQAGGSLTVDASQSVMNSGVLRAGGDLAITAIKNIENISGTISGSNVTLASITGDIINKRFTENQALPNATATFVGAAGSIIATNGLSLTATNGAISVVGSNLEAANLTLKANTVEIAATQQDYAYRAGGKVVESTTYLGSNLTAKNIAIESTGKTTVAGSTIAAEQDLTIKASELAVLSVTDTFYEETRTHKSGFMSSETTTTRHAEAHNVGSTLSGGNVSLSTTSGNIDIEGSRLKANETLALDSAGDISVSAGYDGRKDETQKEKSGFFSGGSFFKKSSQLQGELDKTAVLSELSGGKVILKAVNDITLAGADVKATGKPKAQAKDKEGGDTPESSDANNNVADGTISLSASNITVENVFDVKTAYSKFEETNVSWSDAAKALSNPQSGEKRKNGKVTKKISDATYDANAEKTTTSTVVGSNLSGANIQINATGTDGVGGNVTVTGSNLSATENIDVAATGDVTIKDAKDTQTTETTSQHGKAELNAVGKNEYAEIYTAIEDARKAEDALKQTKASYEKYKRDIAAQEQKLSDLKQKVREGLLGFDQGDVDELQSYVNDLKSDDQYYKANIALAATNFATKTAGIARQIATAISSSGTWGFSIGMELNVDMLEQKLNEQKQKSVASNLNASNINIKAGKTTTIQGSNVGAANDLTIEAENLNVLAAKDINTSQSTSEHKNVNISYGMYSGGSVSASADKSESDTTQVTHTNSQLGGKNVKLKAKDTTTIEGANIAASDKLSLDTKHLTVASVQDTEKSRSSSVGISVSGGFTSSADNRNNGGTGKGSSDVSGGGINASNSHSSSKQTVLTTLTGGNVDINVEEDTTLTGATIAAVDANGNDNGQLKFTTGTLQVSALSNTTNSTEMSLNVGAGSTMSLDASVDKKNSKTKTLGTIGNGDIQINDKEHSDTKLLNHDIANNTLDIYDIESHKGLQGSLDTRFLSEKGRNQIAEDLLKSSMIGDAVKMIITTDKAGVTDFFSETDKYNKTYEAVKEQIAKDPSLGAMLQDPNLSAQDKEKMLNQLTGAVMQKLEYQTFDTKVVSDGKDSNMGFYSKDTQTAYMNDANNNNTSDMANTAFHEASHAMDQQSGDAQKYSKADLETYAKNYGNNVADYTNMALTMNGYRGGMAETNNRIGDNSPFVLANTAQYHGDKSNGDARLPPASIVIPLLGLADKASTAYDVYQLQKAQEEGRTADAEEKKKDVAMDLAPVPDFGLAAKATKATKGVADTLASKASSAWTWLTNAMTGGGKDTVTAGANLAKAGEGGADAAKAASAGAEETKGAVTASNASSLVPKNEAPTVPPAKPKKPEVDPAADTSQKGSDDVVTLYRGVDDASPAITDAVNGTAKPRGGIDGHADANAHSDGATETSSFTSWTTDPEVAKVFATNDSGTGVVLNKDFKVSDLVHPSKPYDPSESEVLIRGDVYGASVTRIKE